LNTGDTTADTSAETRAAYAVCRAIARREAKNFYYAFLALPAHKRDAMCAVYAFMRHADDLSDDESKSHAERRAELCAWMKAWKRAAAGEPTSDPVFRAVVDTQRRFGIADTLLEQLVEGTAMDLEPANNHAQTPAVHTNGALHTYNTFADLYRYCYYVASVVGLVCIRIFGYSDPGAEKLAEETGIAFQLTNILRDVREDAERGRIYLPLEDLTRFGATAAELAAITDGQRLRENQRRLLAEIARRAESYYTSADRLLPLIDRDSRPALRVLVRIYSNLLKRIEARHYDVFSTRVSVPTWQKLSILARGMAQMGMQRLGA
jgi:phytoene synthase